MKIKVLGSFGSEGQGQRPSAFLVDDKVLVDAGTVGGALSPAEQIEVEYALVSHAHFDHIAGLAFLTDTLAMIAPERRVTACSIGPVLDSLRTHVFNDVVWPNFANIPHPNGRAREDVRAPDAGDAQARARQGASGHSRLDLPRQTAAVSGNRRRARQDRLHPHPYPRAEQDLHAVVLTLPPSLVPAPGHPREAGSKRNSVR